MQVSNVGLDQINEQQNKTKVSQIDGFAAQSQNKVAQGKNDDTKDTIVFDQQRVNLRALCESGKAMDNVLDIINSGIEPDYLRAELAFRFNINDKVGMNIVLNYLAGNFKSALEDTALLETTQEAAKYKEFMLYAGYFGGSYEKTMAAVEDMQALNFSPFLCYAYADMLLSMGFLDKARKFNFRYEILAKQYLPDYVSEKEKYEEEKKRRNQKLRRNKEKAKGNKKSEKSQGESGEQSPLLYETIRELLDKRRKLVKALTTRNININKRPLMWELEDIDYQIAKKTDSQKLV